MTAWDLRSGKAQTERKISALLPENRSSQAETDPRNRGRLRPLRATKISRKPRIPMPAAAFWIGDGPSVPCGDIARCNKGCNPPYRHGLGQEWRVTLIRYDDDFELTTAYQHRIHSSRGQHI
jgi:hypothetical protein